MNPALTRPIQLGLRQNLPQFSLLVLVNAFVGAMVGMERSILPAIATEQFQLAARSAILSFIVVFGLSKALTNYVAGRWADRFGSKHILVAGWLVAAPVPFLLMWAPSWSWILVANLALGVSQGLTWSATVIMKIDLAGPKKRRFAMGINEFASYFAVALSALATGWLAARFGLRPQPFYVGVVYVTAGLGLSVWAVRETREHAAHESRLQDHASAGPSPPAPSPTAPSPTAPSPTAPLAVPTPRAVFLQTSFLHPDLSSVSQAGLVNNLNDGMAWEHDSLRSFERIVARSKRGGFRKPQEWPKSFQRLAQGASRRRSRRGAKAEPRIMLPGPLPPPLCHRRPLVEPDRRPRGHLPGRLGAWTARHRRLV